jgi:hypothetical protein
MSKIITGGVPYALDVKRLTEAFPVNDLTEDRVITHEDLEGTIQLRRGTQRYYGVINSWLHKMKQEAGIYMIWEPGDGVKVLNPAGLLFHAETRTRQKIKQTVRAIRIYGHVEQRRDRLDETGRARLDHMVRVANKTKEAIEQARKDMAVELAPVKSLPKRQIA